MIEYDVQTIPFTHVSVKPEGVMEPLCNSCACPDCANPIRDQKVSIFGKTTTYRLYTFNNVSLMVINCKGYVGDENVPVEMDTKPF